DAPGVSMSIDKFLYMEYDREKYNCLHFSAEVWNHLTGDVRLLQVDDKQFRAGEIANLFRGMKRVSGPTVSPSLVLMVNLEGENHIGVCNLRRLIHINAQGPQNLCFDASLALFKK